MGAATAFWPLEPFWRRYKRFDLIRFTMLLTIGNDLFSAIFIVTKPVPRCSFSDRTLIWVEWDTARKHQGTGIVKTLPCRFRVSSCPAIEHLGLTPINDNFLFHGSFLLPLLVGRKFVTYGAKMVFGLETVIIPANDQILNLHLYNAENIFSFEIKMLDGIRLAENERGEIFLFWLYRFRVRHFPSILLCLSVQRGWRSRYGWRGWCSWRSQFDRRVPVFQSSVQQERNQEQQRENRKQSHSILICLPFPGHAVGQLDDPTLTGSIGYFSFGQRKIQRWTGLGNMHVPIQKDAPYSGFVFALQ
ncbi:MAG: hypothetical protein FWD67_04475 [Betaproteobacteria bacterium]|nr:hypothetical protein [Betaproteobacteria bacterium]